MLYFTFMFQCFRQKSSEINLVWNSFVSTFIQELHRHIHTGYGKRFQRIHVHIIVKPQAVYPEHRCKEGSAPVDSNILQRALKRGLQPGCCWTERNRLPLSLLSSKSIMGTNAARSLPATELWNQSPRRTISTTIVCCWMKYWSTKGDCVKQPPSAGFPQIPSHLIYWKRNICIWFHCCCLVSEFQQILEHKPWSCLISDLW